MFYDSRNDRRRFHALWQRSASHNDFPSFGGPPPWARGGGGFWGRGGGFPKGRKLSSADLQLVLLALLEEKPAHGYELIRALEEKSGGFYSPSPGVIYPALTYLDEIGHAEAEAEGKRKLYHITQAGSAHLAENREKATALLDALGRIAGRMDRVRAAFDGAEEAEEESEHVRTIRALKRALHRKRGCPAEEAQRIAEILQRAIDEIEASTR